MGLYTHSDSVEVDGMAPWKTLFLYKQVKQVVNSTSILVSRKCLGFFSPEAGVWTEMLDGSADSETLLLII